MSAWSDFHERHERGNYTPVFNSFLDAQIADAGLELPMRVLAWVQRNSWGRHSDACVNAERMRAGQKDCARELCVLNGKGEPDRRKINGSFQYLAQRGVIRLDGWDIVLLDPAMVNKLPKSERGPTLGEVKAKLSASEYVEQVWKVAEPSVYEEYQIVEQRYKELRMKLITELKAHNEKSERGATSDEECPEGFGHRIGEGSDNEAERGPTIPAASLYENGKHLYNGTSSSFSTIQEALRPYGQTDDDVINQLWQSCQKKADCKPEEIAHFIQVKAALITQSTRNPIGFLLHAVPKCITPQSIDQYRSSQVERPAAATAEQIPTPTVAEQIEQLEGLIRELPAHAQVDQWRAELAALRRKPVGSAGGEQPLRKAGQA